MHALVIDDSRALRRILCDMLSQLGLTTSQAENGRQGLEQLASGPPPDVILVDWNMPAMNGLEFIRHARRQDAWRSVPIIMVTTETELEQIALAMTAGATEYVMKPFTKDCLADKLDLVGVVPLAQ